MGKHSAPRRGSLAFRPRGRKGSHLTRVRNWPKIDSEKPTLLGAIAFKAGTIHIITVDDREKTPNTGKPLFNPATVIATAPMFLIGIRGYRKTNAGRQAFGEVYAKDLPKTLTRKVRISSTGASRKFKHLEESLNLLESLSGIISVSPKDAGLSQKKPYVLEVGVGGGDLKSQYGYLKENIGKEIKVGEIFKAGAYVDTHGVTKGKGFEGPVTRHGIKRKEHKARKSVRAVGALNPWSPTTVRYTVPRAGQMGFHQRVDRNHRVIVVGNEQDQPVTPKGGFHRFGVISKEYLLLRGSVPGPAGRPVTLSYPMRPPSSKIEAPKILSISSVPLEQ